ncbi:MAG: serine hydrolase [Chloroflexota bacterium]|nr:MAG: serine hydrolase [Chloroflexota bacterium]
MFIDPNVMPCGVIYFSVMRIGSFSALRWVSLFLILGAVALFTLQLVRFSRLRANFPEGMEIAEVPVGGEDRSTSAKQLLEVYSATPVELHYAEEVIHLDPAIAEFKLDLESMLAAADLVRSQQPFWVEFWDYLWGRTPPPASIPLRASFSEPRLRSYLENEIAQRYDQPPIPSIPSVGTVNFQPGIQGTELDINRSVGLIETALRSNSRRVVDLPLSRKNPPRPSISNLEILLKQTVDLAEFDGLVGLYLEDLQTGEEINFAYQQGEDFSTNPDVAFTSASITKVPIMVSTYRRLDENPDSETTRLIEEMIQKSGNDPADWLMERVIDPFSGPLDVTADMNTLGLENTFLAGQFYPGAPLLSVYQTPANQRTDINTDPDVYNQTTSSDIGMLFEDIYQCAEFGGGNLMAVFQEEFDQAECQSMINSLVNNKIGLLIEAGVPDGTPVAHKHGWVTYFGVMNTLGDAGIVYTPGGNYVLAIFIHHPDQLIWEPASELVATLSEAIYNYFNQ